MMRLLLAGVLALLLPGLQGCKGGEAVEGAGAMAEAAGLPAVEVGRVWAEPAMGLGYAEVTLTNGTGRSFADAVRVRCDAFDAEGTTIGSHRGSFFATDHGTMGPGFTGKLKVAVPLDAEGLETMDCLVEQAN